MIDFDGSDDNIDFGNDASLLGYSKMSMRVLYQTNTTATSADFILQGTSATVLNFKIRFGSGNKQILFYIDGSGNYVNSSTNSITSTSAIYDLMFVFDGSETGNTNRMKIYINGSLDTAGSSGTIPTSIPSTSYNLSAGNNAHNGKMGEFTIWDEVALTATEVSNIYNSGMRYMPFQYYPDSLVLYAPIDDGPEGTSADGDTIYDISGTGNDGVGDDGAGNTGLTWKAQNVLSYPPEILPYITESSSAALGTLINAGLVNNNLTYMRLIG